MFSYNFSHHGDNDPAPNDLWMEVPDSPSSTCMWVFVTSRGVVNNASMAPEMLPETNGTNGRYWRSSELEFQVLVP